MHVARNKRTYVAKSGEQRVYESVLVRRTYREAGKVRHETLANLSALPAEAVAAVEATLKGERLVPAGQAVTITASLPHGHVAAVHAMAAKLGLPALLGPAGRPRDLALALVISRVVGPGLEAVHPGLVGRYHPGRRPGRGAGRPPMTSTRRWTGWRAGRTRSRRGWPPATWPRRPTRPGWRCSTCLLVAGRHALPAGRPRLLPRRQERHAADRVRAAHRPRGPPGRGPGLPRQHRRPGRVHRDRQGAAGQVRPGEDGHGRRPRHDHQRPHRGAEPAGGRRGGPAGPLRVDHRAARPGHQEADGRRRPAAAVACSTSRTWPRSPPATSPASG